jgi:predicted Zn-ribbon and HTH transcriptional regulator
MCFKLYERADIKKPSFCSGCKSKGIGLLEMNNFLTNRNKKSAALATPLSNIRK